MKKVYLLSSLLIAAAAVSLWFLNQEAQVEVTASNSTESEYSEEHKAPIQERNEWKWDYLNNLRMNIDKGYVDPADYLNAVNQADAMLQNGARALNLTWEHVGPDNVGGRTRALMIDMNDPNTIYAGGVSGGLFKSTDGALTWTSFDCFEIMTIVSITQAANGDIYVGTGEGNYAVTNTGGFGGGIPGDGIWKSTDGQNFNVLQSTVNGTQPGPGVGTNFDFSFVNRLGAHPTNPNVIYAATRTGIWKTEDAGLTWNRVLNLSNAGGVDLKVAKNGNIYVAGYNPASRIHKSTDEGNTWNIISTGSPWPNTLGRIELAIAPSDFNGNIVYAAATTTAGCLEGIYRTQDGGQTWDKVVPATSSANDVFAQGARCQGDFDNTIAVMPDDPDKIYVGGIQFFSWGDPATGGAGWKQSASLNGGAANPQYIHADKHAIAWDENNPDIMYVGSDGGVNKTTNAKSAFPFPDYSIRNRDYLTTQFYDISVGLSGSIMGGTQDNGTQLIDAKGNTSKAATQVKGGDGGYSAISHINPNFMIASSQYATFERSGNGGQSFSGFYDAKIDPNGNYTDWDGSDAPFIAVGLLVESTTAINNRDSVSFTADRNYVVGETITLRSKTFNYAFEVTLTQNLTSGQTYRFVDQVISHFYMAKNSQLWYTPDALNLSVQPQWYRVNGISGTPYSISASEDGDIVYVGTSSGRLYRIEGMTSATLNYPPGSQQSTVSVTPQQVLSGVAQIVGVAVDQNDSDHIVATTGNYGGSNKVYRSTNGTTFTSIQNNLPVMPVFDVVIDYDNRDNYILGTDLGIWTSDDAGQTWTESNNGGGICRTPVFRVLQEPLYNDGCQVIYAGTHGKGMFRSTTLTPAGCNLQTSIETPGIGSEVDFKIFPNPVVDYAQINFILDDNADIIVNVFDVTGRMVQSDEFNGRALGETAVTINMQDLPRGNYIINVATTTGLFDSKVVTLSK